MASETDFAAHFNTNENAAGSSGFPQACMLAEPGSELTGDTNPNVRDIMLQSGAPCETAANPDNANCNRDFGGASWPCLAAAFPSCEGFVQGSSWGRCWSVCGSQGGGGGDGGCAATGASVTYDGDCWQHSHPNILNVYDFTTWTVAADTHFSVGTDGVSSPNHVRSFALAGEVIYQWGLRPAESVEYWRGLNADYSKLGSQGFENYQVLFGDFR
jgi:hypothetical protein